MTDEEALGLLPPTPVPSLYDFSSTMSLVGDDNEYQFFAKPSAGSPTAEAGVMTPSSPSACSTLTGLLPETLIELGEEDVSLKMISMLMDSPVSNTTTTSTATESNEPSILLAPAPPIIERASPMLAPRPTTAPVAAIAFSAPSPSPPLPAPVPTTALSKNLTALRPATVRRTICEHVPMLERMHEQGTAFMPFKDFADLVDSWSMTSETKDGALVELHLKNRVTTQVLKDSLDSFYGYIPEMDSVYLPYIIRQSCTKRFKATSSSSVTVGVKRAPAKPAKKRAVVKSMAKKIVASDDSLL